MGTWEIGKCGIWDMGTVGRGKVAMGKGKWEKGKGVMGKGAGAGDRHCVFFGQVGRLNVFSDLIA